MRYKRIQDFSVDVIKPMIIHLKRIKQLKNMPWKDLEAILKILYPETKYEEVVSSYYKHVFVIHSNKRWFALKIGKNAAAITKDRKTYEKLPKTSRNRYYAKIYWAKDIFMLQKWGEKVEVPEDEVRRLKKWGRAHNLTDVRPANIMKCDGIFKIVDAERA
jgi:hypothetical protein